MTGVVGRSEAHAVVDQPNARTTDREEESGENNAGAADSAAQTAGSTLISTEQLREVATGWSAKKQILGKDVYNDAGEKIGDIIDVCVSNRHTMFSRDTLGTCDHREAPRSWSDGDGAGLSC